MLGNNDYGWTPGKAAKISLKDKICPECLRLKATNGREAGMSCYCPKWYAVNDDDAKRDYEMVSKAKQAAGITSDDESCGCCEIYRTEWSQARTEADELFKQREQLHTELLKAREELRGADEYQAGLRTEIARQVGLVDAAEKSAENWRETAETLGKQVAKVRAALTEIVSVKNIPRDDFDGCPSNYDESCYRRDVASKALAAEASNE